jgi:stage V sporulation protein G
MLRVRLAFGCFWRRGGPHAMDITDVRVYPVNEDKLRAYVTITLDSCFVIRDLKVIHGSDGLFIAMPAKRRKDGTFKDIAHPLNAETRQKMEKIILDEYDKEIKRVYPQAQP